VLEEPVVCTFGQRFILRFYSPLITIGGGEVIYPYSYKPRGTASRAKILERINSLMTAKTPQSRFEYLIGEAGSIDNAEASMLIQDTQENITAITAKLISQGKITELDNAYLSEKYCDELIADLKDSVVEYQKAYSSEAGIPLESLKVSRSLVSLAVSRGLLVNEGGKLRTPDFIPQNDEAFNAHKALIAKLCLSRKWQLMTLDELKVESGIPSAVFAKVIQAMRNAGDLALIPEGYLLIYELEQEMRDTLRSLGNQVTLAQVRDATGSTRKFILPILEYFDSKGYTRRAGDYRAVL
jgi:selenocysteine-specific elongation factor